MSQFLDSEDVTPLRSVAFFVTLRNLAASAVLTAFGGYTFAFIEPGWSFESSLEFALAVDKNPVLKVNNSMVSGCVK